MENFITEPTLYIILILITWIYILKKDIHNLSQTQTQLQYSSEHDDLTGLANGTIVIDRLHQSIKNAQRNKKKIAALYLNLDNFQQTNETFGTELGDQLLQQLSKKLLDSLRDSDTVARIGGDEFIIILDNFEDSSLVTLTIDKIIALSNRPCVIEGKKVATTFSIGVSVYSSSCEYDAQTMLSNAASAMKHVKDTTKNAYKIYEDNL